VTVLELLRNDHIEAMGMIVLLESLEGKESETARQDTLGRLREAFRLHAELEEQIFYPALEHSEATRLMVKQFREEHREVEKVLSRISRQGGDWDNDLSSLKKRVKRHCRAEEDEMFPQAERLLGKDRLKDMGREIAKRKQVKIQEALKE
jgi:hemerythrin-like domain-containing protein